MHFSFAIRFASDRQREVRRQLKRFEEVLPFLTQPLDVIPTRVRNCAPFGDIAEAAERVAMLQLTDTAAARRVFPQ